MQCLFFLNFFLVGKSSNLHLISIHLSLPNFKPFESREDVPLRLEMKRKQRAYSFKPFAKRGCIVESQ
uniref:Putative ovule protein n=1 Tax=Solanum chacoense TaxID=4108 RepID=A0A0V0HVU4_SOLCH